MNAAISVAGKGGHCSTAQLEAPQQAGKQLEGSAHLSSSDHSIWTW
jgi:hypothetical protein